MNATGNTSEFEDNTAYLVKIFSRHLVAPQLVGDVFAYVITSFAVLFLVATVCDAASQFVFSVFLPFVYLGEAVQSLFSTAATRLFLRFKGAGDVSAAQSVFAQSLATCLLFATGLSLFAALFAETLVGWLGVPADYASVAARYARVYLPALAVGRISLCLRDFISCDNAPRYSSCVSVCTNASIAILQGVLLLFFRTGVLGCAWGILVPSIVAMLVYLVPFVCGMTTLRLSLQLPKPDTLRVLFRLASTDLLTKSGSAVTRVFVNRWLISVFGPSVLPIAAVAETFAGLVRTLRDVFAKVTAQLESFFLGERNPAGVRQTFWHGLRKTFATTVFCCLALSLFAPVLTGLFNLHENFSGEIALAIRTATLSYVATTWFALYRTHCAAAGFALVGCAVTLAGDCVLTPLTNALFILGVADERLYWYAPVAAEIANLLLSLLVAFWMKRRTGRDNMLLMDPPDAHMRRMSFLFDGSSGETHDYSEMFGLFLSRQGVGDSRLTRALTLFDELLAFARRERTVRDAKRIMSLRTAVEGDGRIRMSFHYWSKRSVLKSVLNRKPDLSATAAGLNVLFMRRLASSLACDRILGTNGITLTISGRT